MAWFCLWLAKLVRESKKEEARQAAEHAKRAVEKKDADLEQERLRKQVNAIYRRLWEAAMANTHGRPFVVDMQLAMMACNDLGRSIEAFWLFLGSDKPRLIFSLKIATKPGCWTGEEIHVRYSKGPRLNYPLSQLEEVVAELSEKLKTMQPPANP